MTLLLTLACRTLPTPTDTVDTGVVDTGDPIDAPATCDGTLLLDSDETTVRWMSLDGDEGQVAFEPVNETDQVTQRRGASANGLYVAATSSWFDREQWNHDRVFDSHAVLVVATVDGRELTRLETTGYGAGVWVGDDGALAFDRGRSYARLPGVVLFPDGHVVELVDWMPTGVPSDGVVPVCSVEEGGGCGDYELASGVVTERDPNQVLELPDGDWRIADQRDGRVLLSQEIRDEVWAPGAVWTPETDALTPVSLPEGVEPLDHSYCGAPTSQLGPDGSVVVPLTDGDVTQVWMLQDNDWLPLGQPFAREVGLATVGDTVAMIGADMGQTFCPGVDQTGSEGLDVGTLQLVLGDQETVVDDAWASFWQPGATFDHVLSEQGACALVDDHVYELASGEVTPLDDRGWQWLAQSGAGE
jgi:hypothetical protein